MMIMDQVPCSITPYSLAIRYTTPIEDTPDLLRNADMSTDLQIPTQMIT